MSPEQQTRVLDPFEQADPSTSRRFGGTGLGMTIVKKLVETMSGQLKVESEVGAGTTVEISLPLQVAVPPAQPQRHDNADSPELARTRIMVADDNAVNRRILDSMLSAAGAEVTCAHDGSEACALWREQDFDLVLLDISMPIIDGTDALREIFSDADRSGRDRPRTIAVTANVMSDQIAQYLNAGFCATLAKPIRKQQLLETVARMLEC